MCRTCLILRLLLFFLLPPARPLATSSVLGHPIGARVLYHIWFWMPSSVVSTLPPFRFTLMPLMLRPALFIALVQWVFLVKVIYGVVRGGERRTLRTSTRVPVSASFVSGPHTGTNPVPWFKIGLPALWQPTVGSVFLIVPPVISFTWVVISTTMGRPIPGAPSRPHSVAPVGSTGWPWWTVSWTTGSEARTVRAWTAHRTTRSCSFWEVSTRTHQQWFWEHVS